ncbi:Ig-like domain-containing protein [Priestia megaterium]
MKKFILFLLVLFLVTSSVMTILPKQARADENGLSSDETKMLFFSHLVYSIVDGYPAGTKITDLNFNDKFLTDFRENGWKEIQSKEYYPKMTIPEFIERNDLDDWVIYDFLDKEEGRQAYLHGFFGAIFKNQKTNEYIVALRGTSKIDDWANNMVNVVLGVHSFQLPYAEKLVAKLPKNAKATVTGHSLGGYMASYITLTKGIKGVTFNAPGFTGKYLKEVQNSKYKNKLTHYTMEHDDIVGNRFTKVGIQYKFKKKDATLITPVTAWHSIKNFYQYAAKPQQGKVYDVFQYSKKLKRFTTYYEAEKYAKLWDHSRVVDVASGKDVWSNFDRYEVFQYAKKLKSFKAYADAEKYAKLWDHSRIVDVASGKDVWSNFDRYEVFQYAKKLKFFKTYADAEKYAKLWDHSRVVDVASGKDVWSNFDRYEVFQYAKKLKSFKAYVDAEKYAKLWDHSRVVDASSGKDVWKTAPDKPKVDAISDQSTVVTGTSEVSAEISIKVGTKLIGSGTVDRSGKFQVTISKQKDGSKLLVTAKDSLGNESKITEITVSKSTTNLTGTKISLKEVNGRIRYNTSLRDTKGQEYNVYVLALQDKRWIAGPDDVWAGVSEGDEIYEGDYQLGVQPKNESSVYLQDVKVKNYQYNRTKNMIFTFTLSKDQSTFLLLSTREASISEGGPVYYLKDGQLKKATFFDEGETSQELYFSSRPKPIGNNNIQLINYWNGGPIGWEFSTYQFNKNSGTFIYKGSKFYIDNDWNEGEQISKQWHNSPSFFVETPQSKKEVLGF